MMTTKRDETLDLRGTAANDEPADSGIGEQQSIEAVVMALQSKIAELEASNHRMRVNNVSLLSRYDALKSRRSFEKRLLVMSGLIGWVASILLLLVISQAHVGF